MTQKELLDTMPVLSLWRHRNGIGYQIIAIANLHDTPEYPLTVVYRNNVSGLVWARRADDWHRSMTRTD